MNAYLNWVHAYPIGSAMLQFAILGTFGEILSKWVVLKSYKYPFTLLETMWKMLVWALLAICIKYAFRGYPGFVDSLIQQKMLPPMSGFTYAFFLSALMNTQFGLTLVILHRVLDNIPEKAKNWKNLDKSMLSLLWFWIPAHTVTFLVPDALRVGLAALWSLALGLILGFNNRK